MSELTKNDLLIYLFNNVELVYQFCVTRVEILIELQDKIEKEKNWTVQIWTWTLVLLVFCFRTT